MVGRKNMLDGMSVTLDELAVDLDISPDRIRTALHAGHLKLVESGLASEARFEVGSVRNAFWADCARYERRLRDVAESEAAGARAERRVVRAGVASAVAAGLAVEAIKAIPSSIGAVEQELRRARVKKVAVALGEADGIDFDVLCLVDARPYEAFLTEPISDGTRSSPCEQGWELEHGNARRFFVGGMNSFFAMSRVSRFRKGGVRLLASRCVESHLSSRWPGRWVCGGSSPSLVNAQPKTYATALETMYALKIAAHLSLCGNGENHNFIGGRAACDSVFDVLKIVPACWHIVGISDQEQKIAGVMLARLRSAATSSKQPLDREKETLFALASGAIVERRLAEQGAVALSNFYGRALRPTVHGVKRTRPASRLGIVDLS